MNTDSDMLAKALYNCYLNQPKSNAYFQNKLFFNVAQILDKKSLVESIRLLDSYQEGATQNGENQEQKIQSEIAKNYPAIKPNIYWMHLLRFLSSKEHSNYGRCLTYFYTEDLSLKKLFMDMISCDPDLSQFEVFDGLQDAFVYDNALDQNNLKDK